MTTVATSAVPTERWWACRTCDTHWWGQPECWSCQSTGDLSMNERPCVGELGGLLLVRPEWSNHP